MKRKYRLVYKGFDHNQAQQEELLFWEKASIEDKLRGMLELIERNLLTGKINLNARRLLRTTAIIKRF